MRNRAKNFHGLSENDARQALLTEAKKWDKLLSTREKRSITKYTFPFLTVQKGKNAEKADV